MMNFRLTRFVMIVAMMLTISQHVSSGQAIPPPPRDNTLPILGPVPEPDWSLKVYYHKQQISKSNELIYETVKNYMNQARLGVPNDRVRYFRPRIDTRSNRMAGWQGNIRTIIPTDTGIEVTLQVSATQPGMFDSLHLIERYSIINGNVSYLGCEIPADTGRWQVGF